MIGAQYVHDHVMHFYHLHALDWVDVVSALKADPKATSALAQSLSSYAKSSPGYFADVQKKLKGFVEAGQLGIFANGYWGHPAYKLPPEANLMAVAHYLEALAWQRDVVAAAHHLRRQEPASQFRGRRRALRHQHRPDHPGHGKGPHYRGGQARHRAQRGRAANGAERHQVQMRDFVDQVYVPDTLAIAGFYKDWFSAGRRHRQLHDLRRFPGQGHGRPGQLPDPVAA